MIPDLLVILVSCSHPSKKRIDPKIDAIIGHICLTKDWCNHCVKKKEGWCNHEEIDAITIITKKSTFDAIITSVKKKDWCNHEELMQSCRDGSITEKSPIWPASCPFLVNSANLLTFPSIHSSFSPLPHSYLWGSVQKPLSLYILKRPGSQG